MDTIHHIAIQVEDIKKALAWYQQQFDVEVEYEDASWAFIKFANVKLALVLPQQHPNHFAIKCDDAAKYGTITIHRDGSKSVYIKDPDNNVVEMIETNTYK